MRSAAIKLNLMAPTRREMFEGREHLVAPVVAIVEGVLNEALLLEEEFGRYPAAWNGIPVPVFHPMINGEYVSANIPQVLERNTIGRFFNASVSDGRLRGEIWIDLERAQAMGLAEMAAAIERGDVIMEVSTGYYADDEYVTGTFNGRPYKTIHRNIRPDHLALLPGEIGACSVEDGCGVPRINLRSAGMKVQEAMQVILRALGLRGDCECQQEPIMTFEQLKQKAEKLKANGTLSAEDFDRFMAMDEEDRRMMSAFLAALDSMKTPNEEEEENPDAFEEEEENPEEVRAFSKQKAKMAGSSGKAMITMSEEDLDRAVSKRVEDAIERNNLISRLMTYDSCPFNERDLRALSTNHLRKLEEKSRPVDYSGVAGFSTNSGDNNVTPLGLPSGVLSKKEA